MCEIQPILLRMKALTIILFLALTACNQAMAQELGDFRWQYRVLLLMDPYGSPNCQSQLKLLKAHSTEIQQRDILIFVFDGKALLDENGSLSPVSVRDVPYPNFEGVILIGKDGGVKLKKKYLQTAQYIFDRIDAMPLRRVDLRDGNKG